MKKILLLSSVLFLALLSCEKDSVGIKPQISFNHYTATEVNAADEAFLMDVSFQVQDSDGDIENGFFVQTIFDSDATVNGDTAGFQRRQMPGLGSHSGGKIDAEVLLHLSTIDFTSGNDAQPDSVHFRVYVEDNAGNISDTIKTPKLPLIKR